jgi:transglutaminase-like putative cysteine protease
MRIRVGFDIAYDCPAPTPMILTLNIHYSRVSSLATPDHLIINPAVPIRGYRDGFGNWCSRVVAQPGLTRIATDAIVNDTGLPDPVDLEAPQHEVDDLPDEVIVYLLASRYCELDRLLEPAWALFANTPPGWRRVQAICDFVHGHLTFGYEHARSARSAWEAFNERKGVCRDFAHLAVALCRCMNIPARYATGYLGDIGVPPDPAPMDFSGWFEAYLGGRWYAFDARHNVPRIGRVLIGLGRDAADVPLSTSFGPNTLASFKVWTHEVAP